MKIERICPICEQKHQIILTKDEELSFVSWKCEGLLIQEAFPGFNPMEREFIKTGYCPDCQSLLFGTDYKSERISG